MMSKAKKTKVRKVFGRQRITLFGKQVWIELRPGKLVIRAFHARRATELSLNKIVRRYGMEQFDLAMDEEVSQLDANMT